MELCVTSTVGVLAGFLSWLNFSDRVAPFKSYWPKSLKSPFIQPFKGHSALLILKRVLFLSHSCCVTFSHFCLLGLFMCFWYFRFKINSWWNQLFCWKRSVQTGRGDPGLAEWLDVINGHRNMCQSNTVRTVLPATQCKPAVQLSVSKRPRGSRLLCNCNWM